MVRGVLRGDGSGNKATTHFTAFFALQLFSRCSYFCVAVVSALQLFLRCSYFCVAVIFASQLFLRSSYFCVAVIFALQLFLRCSYCRVAAIFALQLFSRCNYFCAAVIFALQLFLRCSYFHVRGLRGHVSSCNSCSGGREDRIAIAKIRHEFVGLLMAAGLFTCCSYCPEIRLQDRVCNS